MHVVLGHERKGILRAVALVEAERGQPLVYERELSKQRFALGRKPRRSRGEVRSSPSSPSPKGVELGLAMSDPPRPDLRPERKPSSELKRRRSVPAAVAREVVLRDGKQCSYVSPDGRRCRARGCLEFDHVQPWALGGECTIENLRLRCRAHNQRYARQCFGTSRVEAAVRHALLQRTTGAFWPKVRPS